MKTVNFNKTVATLTVICLVVIQAIPAGFAAGQPEEFKSEPSSAKFAAVPVKPVDAIQQISTVKSLPQTTSMDFLLGQTLSKTQPAQKSAQAIKDYLLREDKLGNGYTVSILSDSSLRVTNAAKKTFEQGECQTISIYLDTKGNIKSATASYKGSVANQWIYTELSRTSEDPLVDMMNLRLQKTGQETRQIVQGRRTVTEILSTTYAMSLDGYDYKMVVAKNGTVTKTLVVPPAAQKSVDALAKLLGEDFSVTVAEDGNSNFLVTASKAMPAMKMTTMAVASEASDTPEAPQSTEAEAANLVSLTYHLDENGNVISGSVDAAYAGINGVKGWVLFQALHQLPNNPNDQDCLALMAELTVTSVGPYGEIFFTLDGEDYKAYVQLGEGDRVILERIQELPVMPFGPIGGRVIVEENDDKTYPYVAKVQQLDADGNFVTIHSVLLTRITLFEQSDRENRWALGCETIDPVSGEIQSVAFGSNINPDTSSGEPTQSTMITTIRTPTTEVQSRWNAYVFSPEGEFFQRQNDLSFSRDGLSGQQSTWVVSPDLAWRYEIQTYDGSYLNINPASWVDSMATFAAADGAEVEYYAVTDISYQVDPVSGLMTEVSFTGHEGSVNGPVVQKHFLCSFETITEVA